MNLKFLSKVFCFFFFLNLENKKREVINWIKWFYGYKNVLSKLLLDFWTCFTLNISYIFSTFTSEYFSILHSSLLEFYTHKRCFKKTCHKDILMTLKTKYSVDIFEDFVSLKKLYFWMFCPLYNFFNMLYMLYILIIRACVLKIVYLNKIVLIEWNLVTKVGCK